VVADPKGDLFGTTENGGAYNSGTVFEIVKTAHGSASTPTTLVSFNTTDGSNPTELIIDAAGDLFGTTGAGGPNLQGEVFEITKTAHGYASTPTILVGFNRTNGSGPTALVADAKGDLFGTTSAGGTSATPNNPGYGTAFEITGSGFSTHKTPSCSVLESHDNFVFDPNLGENTGLNSKLHDQTIDHPRSEFAQLAELLAQSHQDAVNPAHDAIEPMHHTATLSAQQAHHFLV
jgi:uncharacterized repeat protein (TIGR03803 family)